MELLEANLRDVDVVLPEALHNVRLRPIGVVAKTKIEVGVCSPGIGVQRRCDLVRQVQRPVEDGVIQTRQAVVIQQREVGPGLDQPDHSPDLAVEHCPVQGAVTGLRVLTIELNGLSTAGDPLEHADQPAARCNMGQGPPGHILAPARVVAAPRAPDKSAQLLGARAQRAGQLASVLR